MTNYSLILALFSSLYSKCSGYVLFQGPLHEAQPETGLQTWHCQFITVVFKITFHIIMLTINRIYNYFGDSLLSPCHHQPPIIIRSWAATLINGTNLALVVTDKECEGCAELTLEQEATEPAPEEVPNPCEVEPLYRKRPLTRCYRFDANESTVCSRSSHLVATSGTLLVLVSHLFYIVLAKLVTSSVWC